MSKHHQKHDHQQPSAHPATIMNGAGAGAEAEKADAQDAAKADAKSADGKSQGADKVLEGTLAVSRWREVANKASSKLSELFDEGKTKVVQGANEVSKRVAGAADEGLDEAFEAIRTQAKEFMEKGNGMRVRIKLRERQLTEVPVTALAAAEAASLWWFGPLRMVLGHLVGRAMLDFEFVSPADPHVSEGRGHLASGDLDEAMSAFDKALEVDHTCAAAHLQRGIVLKIRGDQEGAKQAFQRAEECDSRGELGAQARKLHAKFS